jgi:hypothetical protein
VIRKKEITVQGLARFPGRTIFLMSRIIYQESKISLRSSRKQYSLSGLDGIIVDMKKYMFFS